MTSHNERLRELVEACGEAASHEHGWKARVSESLGIHPTILSSFLGGRRKFRLGTVLEMAARIGLDAAYFMEPSMSPEEALAASSLSAAVGGRAPKKRVSPVGRHEKILRLRSRIECCTFVATTTDRADVRAEMLEIVREALDDISRMATEEAP